MPTFFDQSALDALLTEIATNSVKICLIDGYTQGDSYALVDAATIGSAVITAGVGGASFSSITSSGEDRTITFTGASGTATDTRGAGAGLHIALTNNSSIVYAVTNETSDQAITTDNPLTFPSFTLTARQPTQG